MPRKSYQEIIPNVVTASQSSPLSTLLLVLVLFLTGFSIFLFQRVTTLEKKSGVPQELQQPARPTELKVKIPDQSEHWRGPKDARYVLVEYSDFECPFCQKFHPTVKQVLQESEDKLAWVYRHHPLQDIHPKAFKLAVASECAAEQGGSDSFWKYSDLVFDKMPSLEISQLPELAQELSINQGDFKKCIDSDKHNKKIKGQYEEGVSAGVQGTPASVIYDLKTGKSVFIDGAQPYEEVKRLFKALQAKTK